MSLVLGKYQLLKNENLDEYYKTIGISFLARKFLTGVTSSMEISQDGDVWTIDLSAMGKTVTIKFKLGEEYEEDAAGEKLKSTTTVEGNTLSTVSILQNGTKTTRVYEFNESGCVLKLKHIESGVEATRHWKRV